MREEDINEGLWIKVKFTKIGNKIKYQLPCKLFCTEMNNEIQNSLTLDKNDRQIIYWLGTNPERLFKNRNSIIRKVNIQPWDSCDVLGTRKKTL